MRRKRHRIRMRGMCLTYWWSGWSMETDCPGRSERMGRAGRCSGRGLWPTATIPLIGKADWPTPGRGNGPSSMEDNDGDGMPDDWEQVHGFDTGRPRMRDWMRTAMASLIWRSISAALIRVTP